MAPVPKDLQTVLGDRRLGHSARIGASGSVPRPQGQGRTVEGALGSLAQLSLFNLTAKIFAFLVEPLAKACNDHHLLTIYLSMGKT